MKCKCICGKCIPAEKVKELINKMKAEGLIEEAEQLIEENAEMMLHL